MFHSSTRIASMLVAAVLIGTPAVAGPPLLCHPFDIGSAQSLPWDGSDRTWWKGRPDYNLNNLVAETEALLTPSTPVLVRMETLRRAAIYASRDAQVAARLMSAFNERARRAGAASDPLVLFDGGYLTETFRQISLLEGETEFRTGARNVRGVIGNADGYAMVARSLSLRPNDPALEFAAALIARGTRQESYQHHAEKARRGMSQDALLARNIRQLS